MHEMDVGPKFIIGFVLALAVGFVFFSIAAPDMIRAMGVEPIKFNLHLF